MTTLHLAIDRSSGVPLYRQIYDGLRRAILERRLHPGQRVPSTRALAAELGVSRLPVLEAYEQLLHEAYLDGRAGSGTYVGASLPDDLLVAPGRAPPRPRPAPRPVDHGGMRPFRTSMPALDQFPRLMWARLVARHAHAMSPSEMGYGDPAGEVTLRLAIAEHLRAARAVRCETDQILIASGSQAGLRLAAAALLAPGDRVALEEPGYPGARAALAAHGARLVPVPVDDEGLRVDKLRARGRARVRAVHVTPSHQYPLGTSMTAARRLGLLEWAARHEGWILEDDYDSEYRYVSRPIGSLQGMDAHDRVIYLGTFSKVLFPALRIGYLVVPLALMPRFIEARRALDLCSPTLYQLVLAELVRGGQFARHLRRMRGVYQRRRDALLTGLARHCAGRLEVHNADAGLHVAAFLPDHIGESGVIAGLTARGLTALGLSPCYAGKALRPGLLLGFGGSTERRLLDATRVLGEVLRAEEG
jgi:GntR family transcriptional regulator / MocR family aminotransferase